MSHMEQFENQAPVERTGNQASESLLQEAFKLYQCPGNGGIVRRPADCFEGLSQLPLPTIQIEGADNTQVAARTRRRNGEGGTGPERDTILDRRMG